MVRSCELIPSPDVFLLNINEMPFLKFYLVYALSDKFIRGKVLNERLFAKVCMYTDGFFPLFQPFKRWKKFFPGKYTDTVEWRGNRAAKISSIAVAVERGF